MKFWPLVWIAVIISFKAFATTPPEPTDVVEIGNKIFIYLPGETTFEEPFEVANDGSILLPELGKIAAQGKSVGDLQEELKGRLAVYYTNLDDFYIEIRSRDIFVNVLGYVNEPSQVAIPFDGNIQMVIAKAGGLKPGAQLDRFQVRRGTESIEFNYKAYLDSGNLDLLPKIKSGDTVFVPVSPLLGNVQIDFDAQTLSSSGDATDKSAVTIMGEVHTPGSYAFKQDMTILDALMRAGGVTRYADVTKVRIIAEQNPTLFDLKAYLDRPNQFQLEVLKPGTTIYVPIIVDDVNTTSTSVYIMGEVQKPGAYETQEKTSLLDILANAGGPTRFAETRHIKILNTDGETKLFDLLAYSEGFQGITVPAIKPGDVVFVPEKTDLNEKSWLKVPPTRAVKIIGAIFDPGRYEWSDEMDFTDLLAHAGGPTKGANLNEIKIVRTGNKTRSFDLEKYKSGVVGYSLPDLQAGDTIIIEELPNDPTDNKSQWIRQDSESSIYVFGQVGSPGRYAFNDTLHFVDILAAADGPNGNADLKNIRITHRNGAKAKVSKLDLALYFETGDESLFPKVSPGDTIFIPEKNKDWLRQPKEQVVRIMGAIQKPGRYNFDETMSLLDILAEAGGPTGNALIDKIVVVNHGCCKEQARVFDFESFVKRPDSSRIPVLRAGDTIYIPDKGQDLVGKAKDNFIELVTLIALLVGL
ncbi:Periplasmic protein SypC involved in polysaccharide export [Pseudoalteromonas luteoviolacea B = ATCC 29581]|nr:Periplasmic protein SypC involved in polysaccharide export [Pseudoalteromonas luteoviolacea B = ATCC 29581]